MAYKKAPQWRDNRAYFRNLAPGNLQAWLTDRQSLTQQLTCACTNHRKGQFRVALIKQSWERPDLDEQRILSMKKHELGFVRQVFLYCDDQPWVYAKTIIPQQTLRGELQKLTQLGTRSLGTVLFANRHIKRENLQICQLNRQNALFVDAMQLTPAQDLTNTKIWGRRSLFRLCDNPLLVNEIFLPSIANKT